MSLLVWIWFLGLASEFVYLWIEWYRKKEYLVLANIHSKSPPVAVVIGLITVLAFALESAFWFISMPLKLSRDYRGNHG